MAKQKATATTNGMKAESHTKSDISTTRVNPKTGRPIRKSAGRKSLDAGFVDTQAAIDGDYAFSSEEDEETGRAKKRRRVKSPPAEPLSPYESEVDESGETLMTLDQEFQPTNATRSYGITVNVPAGLAGPFEIKLDMTSFMQPVMVKSLSNTIQVSGMHPKALAGAAAKTKRASRRNKSSETTSMTPKVGFLSLAPEIRNMIYTLVLVTDEPLDLARPSNFCRTSALLRTCKAVEAEASQILYGNNSFRLERQFRSRARYWQAEWNEVGWKDVRRWLHTIGPVNISYLRNVLMKFDDAMPSANPHLKTPEERRYVYDENLIECLKMLAHASGLHTLYLNFSGRKQLHRTDHRFLDHLTKLRADKVQVVDHPSWKEGTWVGYYDGYHRGVNRIACNVEAMVKEKMTNKVKLYQK